MDIAMNHWHRSRVQKFQARSGVVELEPAISYDELDMVGYEHSLQTS